MTTIIRFVALALLGLSFSCADRKASDNPYSLQQRIIDHAEILTAEQEDSLITIMEDLELKIGPQIAILTVPTLDGEKIEEFSFNTFEATRLGRDKYNDGVLITIVYQDREMRIEVGTGLENILKDEIAAQILRDDIAPKFKEGSSDVGYMQARER